MTKEEIFINKFKSLPKNEYEKAKILYKNIMAYEWCEEERDGEIVATVVVKSTGEKYDVLDYIKDESVVLDTTALLLGKSRSKLTKNNE